ncbi:MAG: M20/M25/M40 family metallo-hydrolase [Flavobacteriaceae bacterium]|jgi:leucyl aminopeptidase|nr:M20/M25/M40 family metallo-hydrolase [Flavobacteriaceae bacterium]
MPFKKLLYGFLICSAVLNLQAQEKFYATMDANDAIALQQKFPNEVQIIDSKNLQSAVYITENAAEFLHKNILTHGPGYIFKANKENALQAINFIKTENKVLNFSITEDVLVNQAINMVNTENIKNHIQILENYGTRRENTAEGTQASNDLKTKWENMIVASGRTDISVRLVNHVSTPMPSVVLTITGTSFPDEYVIVGGHLDSFSNVSQAPGADDDASGIATITEMFRILLDMNFKPQRTVEFMAYAAEEVGLVGSSEIASDYSANSKNVISVLQLDMTNYKGSSKDIYLATDPLYVSNDLNLFLIELMTHYNSSGTHTFTYGNTLCSYGCSDHASWAAQGYDAAFPFESAFGQHDPNIHTAGDTLAFMGNNVNHSAKFAKLGLEYIIESAKSEVLAVQDVQKEDVKIYVENKILKYQAGKNVIDNVSIIDTSGRNLLQKNHLPSIGQVDLSHISSGFYLAVFKTKDGKIFTKKFIL